jgi:hypothetical protein
MMVHIGAIWIAATAHPTNTLVVDCYRRPRLDQRRRPPAKPIFWSHRSDFAPERRPDAGGGIVRQFFGEPILAGLSKGPIQTAP